MESSTHGPECESDFDPAWAERQRYWRRKLGRLRLGVEPLEEQLGRHRRTTWVLTVVTAGVALLFLGLFAAFRRPDIGGLLALVLLAPIVALAWIDHALMISRARRYLRELRAHQERPTAPGRT